METEKEPTDGLLVKLFLIALFSFTVTGTWEVVRMTSTWQGPVLVFRQLLAIVFTDGAILYWHHLKPQFKTERQQTRANYLLIESIASVAVLMAAYIALSVMGNRWQGVMVYPNIMGFVMEGTIIEFVDLFMLAIIGAQCILGLAATVGIIQMSPKAARLLAKRRAEEQVIELEQSDYVTAQKTIAPIVGRRTALLDTRRDLEKLNRYTADELDTIISLAEAEIDLKRGNGSARPTATSGSRRTPDQSEAREIDAAQKRIENAAAMSFAAMLAGSHVQPSGGNGKENHDARTFNASVSQGGTIVNDPPL